MGSKSSKIIIGTKAFGQKEIDSKSILHFPEGIFAFEEYHKFVILPHKKGSQFFWLQSLDEPSLAFLTLRPHDILEKYEPELLPDSLSLIELDSWEKAQIYCIVTIPPNQPEKMTVNLQGPILINPKKGLGGQFISADEKHLVRMPVLEIIESGGKL
ncbi:MAG: flagellar assembly protein FliW [Candidatus Hydrogenedentota bacterium]|nr:MAG: flagellar assembly protein FliW [Candidatus Hydrogenedentota bacterium]